MRQNCYSRVDQRNQYQNPETTQPHPQSGVRIAALEAEDAAETGAAQFNHQEAPRVHSFFASSTQDKKITRGYDSGPTRKLAKPTMTFPPSNQLNQQQGEQEAQPERVYYARRSNPPTLGSTEVPRISTIQAVQPINYNSVKKNEARARDILKTEFTESALNSKRQSHSDQTHSTFHPQHSQENATEPETYTKTKPNSSEKVIVMTTSHKENLQVTNATQTVAIHSDPTSEDQAHITLSEQRCPIDDEPVPSASDQKTIGQELSYANTVTEVHSKLKKLRKGLQSLKRLNLHTVVFLRNELPLSLAK